MIDSKRLPSEAYTAELEAMDATIERIVSTVGEYVRPQFTQKTHASKDESAYRAWGARRHYCYHCGTPRNLTTHHIVKQGRSHDAANLVRLCIECHNLAEGLTVRDSRGEVRPKLTLGKCLALKSMYDPDEYDPVRLQELRGSRLPDPEPLD